MKILIDIGHPAHVHYFRNLIKLFIKDGDNVLVVARKKDVTQELLNYYNISYINRGKGGNGVFSKILYLLKADIFLLIKAIKFKPDILFSFSTIYPAHVSFLIKKPFIAITDTEHAKEQHKMFIPL